MSPSEAQTLDHGMIVVSRHTLPPLEPRKVKAIWVNRTATIARVQFVGHRDQWFDVEPWERAPDGHSWSLLRGWQPTHPS